MELSAYIRKHALSIPGKLQLIMIAFAKALEIIPRQICDNAGLDSTDVLNKLRMKHANGEKWYGVDVDGATGVRDNMDAFVWEPSLVKLNAISSATEAACLILSVDETVRNPQSEQVRLFHISYTVYIGCLGLMLILASFSQTLDLKLLQEPLAER
jgi:T-complex protein 1 subunit eta